MRPARTQCVCVYKRESWSKHKWWWSLSLNRHDNTSKNIAILKIDTENGSKQHANERKAEKTSFIYVFYSTLQKKSASSRQSECFSLLFSCFKLHFLWNHHRLFSHFVLLLLLLKFIALLSIFYQKKVKKHLFFHHKSHHPHAMMKNSNSNKLIK